jgi:hypothetical protein
LAREGVKRAAPYVVAGAVKGGKAAAEGIRRGWKWGRDKYKKWRRRKKTPCKNCKKSTRHNPCKAKNTPSKKNNSMIDPDAAKSVNKELDDIIAGKVVKDGDTWIAKSGRTYGEHGGTLFPKEGPGIVNLSRGEHKYLTRLNSVGEEAAAFELDRMNSDLTPEQRERVKQMYRKCKSR